MSINAFLFIFGMNWLLPMHHNQRMQLVDVINIHAVKSDTLSKKMTPVQVRRSDDRKKLIIVFSESSRFFSQRLLAGSSLEREQQKWQHWINNKTGLTVSFTEDKDGTPYI